jgi:hypothetical protein
MSSRIWSDNTVVSTKGKQCQVTIFSNINMIRPKKLSELDRLLQNFGKIL